MSPRNAFKFEHGARRGKPLAVPAAPAWRAKAKPRCQPGTPIKSLQALVAYLEESPSVWVGYARKPLPSTVVLNWQMRQVVKAVSDGVFSQVVRPKPRRAIPIITDRDFA